METIEDSGDKTDETTKETSSKTPLNVSGVFYILQRRLLRRAYATRSMVTDSRTTGVLGRSMPSRWTLLIFSTTS